MMRDYKDGERLTVADSVGEMLQSQLKMEDSDLLCHIVYLTGSALQGHMAQGWDVDAWIDTVMGDRKRNSKTTLDSK